LEPSTPHKIVLLKTRERRSVAASNSKEPVSHDAFRVHDVSGHLLDGPLAGRLGDVCARLRHLAQQSASLFDLAFKELKKVLVRHFADVGIVIGSIFIAAWPRNGCG
jgi:hypothetical protein